MRFFIVLLIAFAFSNQSFSQYYYYNDNYYDRNWIVEVGGGIGGMNSISDIGGSKSKGGMYINDINLSYTQLSSSFYIGALYQQLIGVRFQATWGSVKAADSTLKGSSDEGALSRYNRNLNFKSTINEIALLAEFHPLSLWQKEEPRMLSPYILAGLGYFRFNPQINLNGRDIDLRPLSLEGQGFKEYRDREKYNAKQTNLPVGLGVKYDLNHRFTVRLEALHRILFTDYLDDVSNTYIDRNLFAQYLPPMQAAQANAIYDLKREIPPIAGKFRGNADSNDSYMTLSLKVGVTLGREKRN